MVSLKNNLDLEERGFSVYMRYNLVFKLNYRLCMRAILPFFYLCFNIMNSVITLDKKYELGTLFLFRTGLYFYVESIFTLQTCNYILSLKLYEEKLLYFSIVVGYFSTTE